jgi:flavodoxin
MPQKQKITDVLTVGVTGSTGRLKGEPAAPGRRALLRGVLLAGATVMTGMQITGCSTTTPSGEASRSTGRSASAAASGKRILLAYFSRPGENYYYGGRTNLKVGNTEVLARMISGHIECDVHRIKAADPYPDDYEETVARNVREQDADARPAIANLPSSIDRYDTVLLGSPIWNVRAPMIMSTFTEKFDFRGKAVYPFTTHAMSGLGTTERDYAASCPDATIGEGLAVRGEEVRDGDTEVRSWLRRTGLLRD